MEQNNSIKITLLEIKPTLKELEKNNNEISIIFQGINVFYSLRKLISNNTEILINNCKKSLIMSLVKSDNIFASALFNIKHGENWVTFKYESKKKSTVKNILNNIDCIKIKIMCTKIIKIKNSSSDKNNNKSLLNSKSIISNDSKTKRYHTNKNIVNIKKTNNINNKGHYRYDSILTESNNLYQHSSNINKISSSKNLNKKASGKIKSTELFKKTRNYINKSQFSNLNHNEFSLITISHRRLNTSSNNIITNTNKNNLISFHSHRSTNKNKQKLRTPINIQNFGDLSQLKYLEVNNCAKRNFITDNYKNIKSNSKRNLYLSNNSPINSFRSKINNLQNKIELGSNLFFGYNKNSTNNNNLNVNKAKQIIKNRLFKNKIQGNITNSYSTTTTKKNEFEGSLNSLQDDYEKNNIKNKNKKNLITSNKQKSKIDSFHTKNKSHYQLILEHNTEKMNNNNKEIEKERISKYLEKDSEEENYLKYSNNIGDEDFDLEEYSRLKNDFNLLYNKEYILNIKNDLLKLEIELFVEKMTELITIYHKIIEKKNIENKIVDYNYKENAKKYILIYKLNNKLQLIKDKYNTKKYNLNNNKKDIKKQKNNNLILNKEEFNIFDKLLNNKNLSKYNNIYDINKKLREILNIILNNKKNKDILNKDKFKIWLQDKQQKDIIINEKNNQNNLNPKIIPLFPQIKMLPDINEVELSDNNKVYKRFKTRGIYIKKTPKSPLYNSKTKINQVNTDF